MNILFVSHCNFFGNSAMHVFSIANTLAGLGVSCAVCVPDHPESVKAHGEPRFQVLDYDQARKLEANSYAPALRVKGDCYARGLGGTPVDLTQAADAYEVAAGKGNVRAEASLGYFYENGIGVPADKVKAFVWYKRAAEAPGPPAAKAAGERGAKAVGERLSPEERTQAATMLSQPLAVSAPQ